MKNYDELTKDLLARRDRYVAEQKQKRVTAVTSLCCVCFVALLGLGLWKSGVFHTTPPINGGPAVIASKPQNDNTNAPTTAPTSAPTTIPTTTTVPATIPTIAPLEITWIVNKVDGLVGAERKNYNTPDYYSESKDTAAMAEHFGRDLTDLVDVMPDGFQFVGSSETTFYYKTDGTLVYDGSHFLYLKENQQILIQVSKVGVPYDCLYMLDNPIPSNINGKEMVIGGFYANENSKEFDLVFADFSHNGIQYRVTVKNVPFDGTKDAPGWLVDILAELIK